MEIPPLILAHTVSALLALTIGGATLALRKGTTSHRRLGRVWVVLIAFTALVSFGIQRGGQFSAIHVLSVATLAGVAYAMVSAARGRIRAHRRAMISVYASLAIAAVFTLLPGRLLGSFVWDAMNLI